MDINSLKDRCEQLITRFNAEIDDLNNEIRFGKKLSERKKKDLIDLRNSYGDKKEGYEDILNSINLIQNITEQEIDSLNTLQAKYNPGGGHDGKGGISCVRTIVFYLRKDDYISAQNVRRCEGDKTRSYPDVEKQLEKMFGCRCHNRHNCQDRLCVDKLNT